jgi:hypothetical protein
MASINELFPQCGKRVNPWTGERYDWNEGANGDHYTYGRWNDAKDGAWIVPGRTSGSDYSGSLVERSNYNVLREMCEMCEESDYPADAPPFWVDISGGYGTYALAFHLERTPEDIKEQIVALESYPLADEDAHSQLEIEAQDEAWNNWAAREYRQALEKKFRGDASEVTDDALFSHFQDAADKANEYWENEQGSDVYIRIDRVVERGAVEPPAGFIPESEE